MPMLDISDLNVGYGETQVLIDVALDIAHGESVSVLGSERGRQDDAHPDDSGPPHSRKW